MHINLIQSKQTSKYIHQIATKKNLDEKNTIQAKILTNFDLDSIGVATHCHQDHDFMHAKHLSERREQILVGHHFELQNKL